MVASEPFRDAATVQADRLGFDAARVFVGHPIQDRTDDEMKIIAEDVFPALVSELTGPTVSG